MLLYLCAVMDLLKRRAAELLIECIAVGCLLIGCQHVQQEAAQQQPVEPPHAVVMVQPVVAQMEEEYIEYYDLYEEVFGQDAALHRNADSVAVQIDGLP